MGTGKEAAVARSKSKNEGELEEDDDAASKVVKFILNALWLAIQMESLWKYTCKSAGALGYAKIV